jgi:hypothetical protein
VETVSTSSGTQDLGAAADMLCVLQSVTGHLTGYGAQGAPSEDVSLYVSEAGRWTLAVTGGVQVTVGCVPWGAFPRLGQPPAVTRYDNGGGSRNPASPVETTDLHGRTDCALSHVGGDFSASGNSAVIGGSTLLVSNRGGDGVWASASCFDGAFPFDDRLLDARQGMASAPLPPAAEALCGLSGLSDMGSDSSSIAASGATAQGTSSLAAVRCFYFCESGDAGAQAP